MGTQSTGQGIRMPKTIDDPDQILLWSMDEFIVVAGLIGVGITFAQLFLSMVGAFFFLKVYRRFREGRPRGFIQHGLYRSSLTGLETVTIRNPFIRRFFP